MYSCEKKNECSLNFIQYSVYSLLTSSQFWLPKIILFSFEWHDKNTEWSLHAIITPKKCALLICVVIESSPVLNLNNGQHFLICPTCLFNFFSREYFFEAETMILNIIKYIRIYFLLNITMSRFSLSITYRCCQIQYILH